MWNIFKLFSRNKGVISEKDFKELVDLMKLTLKVFLVHTKSTTNPNKRNYYLGIQPNEQSESFIVKIKDPGIEFILLGAYSSVDYVSHKIPEGFSLDFLDFNNSFSEINNKVEVQLDIEEIHDSLAIYFDEKYIPRYPEIFNQGELKELFKIEGNEFPLNILTEAYLYLCKDGFIVKYSLDEEDRVTQAYKSASVAIDEAILTSSKNNKLLI